MKLGAQSYTVRAFTQNERDFAESMRRISAIGYRYVQISGVGPLKASLIRRVCDDHGLKIVLTHTKLDVVNDLDGVLEYHAILGTPYIGIGGSGEKYRAPGWVSRFAEDYYEPARRMREAGFRFMYHTHSDEFGRLPDGRLLLEGLLEGMPEELMGLTLDLYWLQYAGCDVLEWIDKLQNRLQCVHLKDMAIAGNRQVMAPLGEGNMNYHAIYALLDRLGKTEYALVEQDDCDRRDPFACLDASYRYWTALERQGASHDAPSL